MLTYILNEGQKKPLYEQLYNFIKDDISSGALVAGEKLPSKRLLAEHLGVSKVTIENAYAQLIAEGYIYSVEKSGYYVDRFEELYIPPQTKTSKKEDKPEREKKYIADFSQNKTEPENFPFSVWSKLMREVMLDFRPELLKTIPFGGLFVLQNAIAAYLYKNRGLTVQPSQIIIGAGTEYLYTLLSQLLGREKIYAYENPCHRKIVQIYNAVGVKSVGIKLDDEGLSADELKKSNADILHISPSHNFPTGIVMPIKRRRDILNWSYEKSERYIIEDDYDCEFRYTGKPIPTLQSIDCCEKVIYINTFSKSIAPSIRIAYMVLPQRLLQIYTKKLGFYSCTVSSFEQYTLARFIEDGYFEKHISRMRKHYRRLRNSLTQLLESSAFANKVEIKEKDAGLHFLLKAKTEMDDESLCEFCEAAGVKINSLSKYIFGQRKNTQTLVVNYSGVSREESAAAVKAIEEALKKRKVFINR